MSAATDRSPEAVSVMVLDAAESDWIVIDAYFACYRCGLVLVGDGFADVRDIDGFLIRVCPGCVSDHDAVLAA